MAYPDHPDNYGSHMQREFRVVGDDPFFGELAPAVTDEEADAMWEQEKQIRAVVAPHMHNCGHECTDGGCVFFCATKDWHCAACRRAIEAKERW